jgi:hypothetical protein
MELGKIKICDTHASTYARLIDLGGEQNGTK